MYSFKKNTLYKAASDAFNFSQLENEYVLKEKSLKW